MSDAKTDRFSRAQHNVKRATTDKCVYVNTDLVPPMNSGLGTSIPDIFGNYAGCLCGSNVQNLVATYLPLSLAASLVGTPATFTWLNNYINSKSAALICIYPIGASAACLSSNFCNFTCGNGLTKVGSACQCVAPKTMCNGVCTSDVCPTGSFGRRNEYLVKTNTLCPTGTERCGVLGSSTAYECLNTQTELESCGGCVITPMFGETPTGQDCSAIPGVADVKCLAGKCLVESCRDGWNIFANGQFCTKAA